MSLKPRQILMRLTLKQLQVFEFIKKYIAENQLPPTQAEIAQAMKFRSATAAKDHLQALARKGYISLLSDIPRGIQLIKAHQGLELPLIGRVAAGTPIDAIENIEQQLSLPLDLFRPKPTFLLRVKGDSMQDAGILDGDLVAIKKVNTAESGQIVVARIKEEVTLKRLKINNTNVQLLPENKAYKPIMVAADSLVIEGVFVGLIRNRIY